MKAILVTGANGFVGRHLVKELVDNGLTVLGITGPSSPTNEDNLASYISLDLLRKADYHKINFKEVDKVVHLAGLAAVGPSFDDPMEYISTNMGIQINLFETALKQKTNPKFLIISSGSLYSSDAPLPLTESSPVEPSSPYAISKLGQEQVANYYSKRGIESIIARPFNHVGPGQSAGFLVPDLAKQVVEFEKGARDSMLVGNLSSKRDYTDVRDIVNAYMLLLEKGVPGQIYNVCSGRAYSGQAILDSLISGLKTRPQIKKDKSKMRPADTPVIYGSYTKIEKDTGWKPQTPLEKTLKDTIDEWRAKLS